MTILLNNCLNLSYFPDEWKIAKVIAFHKKKEKSDPSNYRPISLLSNLGKLFESVIHIRISNLIDAQEMIPDHQFGFRKKHSTIHAINKLTSDICWALNDDQVLAACLIDLEKAFDTVWTQGLLYKLLKKGFPHLINITWNMTLG